VAKHADLGNYYGLSGHIIRGFFFSTHKKVISMNNSKRYYAKLYWLQSAARRIIPGERVGVCCRLAVPGKKVQIWGDTEERKAKYRNVVRCANVWQCPVCANHITTARRKELSEILRLTPGIPIMLTFTMSHHRIDTLEDSVRCLCEAWSRMVSCRQWKDAKNDASIGGYVRALEVTWSKNNGWHPHFHVLFFIDCGNRIAEFYRITRLQWQLQLEMVGASCSYEHGCTLSVVDDSIEAYIAKWGHDPSPDNENVGGWGMASEVSRGALKSGRLEGLTPFQILEKYLLNGQYGPAYWGRLWREYAYAFKGKRQLTWSRNPDPRKIVGIPVTDDGEIIEGDEAGYVLLATIEDWEWAAIIHTGSQGMVLDCAARGDNAMMRDLISDCCEQSVAVVERAMKRALDIELSDK
jgi:hypothetical protein